MGSIGILSLLFILILALIVIGIIGIRRHQPQLVLIAWISLAIVLAVMIWFLLTPSPSGAVLFVQF